MRHILKKSLRLTFASILAVKAGDYIYKHHTNDLKLFCKKPARAEAVEQIEDAYAKILKTEFTADLSSIPYEQKAKYDFKLKSRDDHLKELMDSKNIYDVVIIGGGACGAGVALEAASRGLKCAVVEAYDFASGTSGRSSKNANGGLRHFEQMMKL